LLLLRPEADLTPAEPPYWFQVREQRYTYEGLDYRRPDTLQITRRTLRDAPREVSVLFNLPKLEDGVYRVEVSADMGVPDRWFRERRDFTVKDAAYPRVTTLDEMVDALVYIARERELKAIRTAATVEEKRAKFEAFWINLAGTPRRASDLIKRYYSRVEEANLLFTSHKRGWQTDQGMVFVIMGPPTYVDQRYGEGRRLSIWRYPPPRSANAPMGYYPVDPNRSPVSQMETRFIFEEARKLDPDIPYPQYILRRNRIYQRIWDDAVEMWRSGSVL
jgi:GWxTD domain-containing protein